MGVPLWGSQFQVRVPSVARSRSPLVRKISFPGDAWQRWRRTDFAAVSDLLLAPPLWQFEQLSRLDLEDRGQLADNLETGVEGSSSESILGG
jgi:hypothetical protein